MDTYTIIAVGTLGGACLVLLVLVVVLFVQVASLKKKVNEMQATGRMRVQKLKMNPDKNHAFHNPALVPEEELSRRGYSMYMGSEPDLDIARPSERQTGGQFVEELTRELDHRHQRQELDNRNHRDLDSRNYRHDMDNRNYRQDVDKHHRQTTAPPFLLQSIEENKKKTRNMFNPVSNGRQSDTNPNFIY
ncbi:uncharacterized protein LOC115441061 isoform X2 [Manduca sexta]|uniref:Uncharacterized protein n=1 Tax=Manduca sexta TaxID=7130 RepID=A0A921YKI5_MANSE|nr:uncharacterized protein LOC115441061 isoform X2 [Manduca sexta]KAG6440848.1 hypothetical protein O3G_MSEX001423 [Manduca sexta]